MKAIKQIIVVGGNSSTTIQQRSQQQSVGNINKIYRTVEMGISLALEVTNFLLHPRD